MHINPDHYLETDSGRVFTAERNQIAWAKCFDDFENEVINNSSVRMVYVLIGCQAAGKSTWADKKIKEEPYNIVFDAILVKKVERAPILDIAAQKNLQCIAVLFKTDLAICLERNAQRTIDKMVDEQALKNVFAAIEAPSLDEGFTNIIVSE
ncbi:AAA family ATPase [Acinetobacter sp. NIPH 298]|uniref:AAA family ATPase n=1 Tax=Acinetobacter sp. NIPH 298 TaxID=1217692 RepID=UPI0002CD7064|nr:AAA family ATPase [Acinetobacter sp. NIPH 298]ENW97738.1 hypothetical protein F903_00258 [Acinetobacter sp. NIPH 298]